jgi:hypothetical protein
MFELARCQGIATEIKVNLESAVYVRRPARGGKIGPTVDFSRLAKDYMETTQEQEALKRSAAEAHVGNGSQSSPMEKTKGDGSASSDLKPSASAKKQKTDDEKDEYSDYTMKELQEACKTAALTKSGTRKVLLERLRVPTNSGFDANRKASLFRCVTTSAARPYWLHCIYMKERLGTKTRVLSKRTSIPRQKNSISPRTRSAVELLKLDLITTTDGVIWLSF